MKSVVLVSEWPLAAEVASRLEAAVPDMVLVLKTQPRKVADALTALAIEDLRVVGEFTEAHGPWYRRDRRGKPLRY